jgi:hypothetical protein
MAQLVIENKVRHQMIERVDRLREYIANYHGPADELGIRVVEEFGAIIPELLDSVDQHLKDTLTRFTTLLKEEGLLKDDIEIVIRGIKAGEDVGQ